MRIFGDKTGWRVILYKDLEDLTMINKLSGEWVLMKTKSPFLFSDL